MDSCWIKLDMGIVDFWIQITTCSSEFVISFEAWAKLAQQWLVCVPLGIHIEAVNKDLMKSGTI